MNMQVYMHPEKVSTNMAVHICTRVTKLSCVVLCCQQVLLTFSFLNILLLFLNSI